MSGADELRSYLGREVDVGLFGNVPTADRKESELILALVSPGHESTVVTGKQKLLQRVWLELTTERGSLTFWPNRGCSFFRELRLNRPRTTAELFSLFALAAEEIKLNLSSEERETDPPDEKLKSLRAVHATLSGNRLDLVLQLEAQDGGTWQFIVPINVSV